MNRFFILLLVSAFCLSPMLTSCSDNDDDSKNEFTNWQKRNDAYFASIRSTALSAISKAKAQHPADWADYCDWRTFISYGPNPSSTANTSVDSIYVQVLRKGTGSGSPLSTDSVRVFYTGRLIPTESYPEGMLFDHSGQSTITANIFNHETGIPATFLVTACTRGFGTALQYMHIGDYWRIFIPNNLGYKATATNKVPAYSTLVFDVELVQYARAGNALPAWR